MSRTEWNLYKAMDKAVWLYDFLEEAEENLAYQEYMKNKGCIEKYVYAARPNNEYCPIELSLNDIKSIRKLLSYLYDDIQRNITVINNSEKDGF